MKLVDRLEFSRANFTMDRKDGVNELKTFKQFEEYDKACDEVIFEHEHEVYTRSRISR